MNIFEDWCNYKVFVTPELSCEMASFFSDEQHIHRYADTLKKTELWWPYLEPEVWSSYVSGDKIPWRIAHAIVKSYGERAIHYVNSTSLKNFSPMISRLGCYDSILPDVLDFHDVLVSIGAHSLWKDDFARLFYVPLGYLARHCYKDDYLLVYGVPLDESDDILKRYTLLPSVFSEYYSFENFVQDFTGNKRLGYVAFSDITTQQDFNVGPNMLLTTLHKVPSDAFDSELDLLS